MARGRFLRLSGKALDTATKAGKGRRQRGLPFRRKTAQALDRYLRLCAPHVACGRVHRIVTICPGTNGNAWAGSWPVRPATGGGDTMSTRWTRRSLERSGSRPPAATRKGGTTSAAAAPAGAGPQRAWLRSRAADPGSQAVVLHDATSGRLALAGETLLQLQRLYGNGHVRRVVEQGRSATGVPEPLRTRMEQLSGVPLDGVSVSYDSAGAAVMPALAYTRGAEIHLASGQERSLPHELWHVVQQRQGRVRPTRHVRGAGLNDDRRLEREADVMGMRAARAGARVEADPLPAHQPAAHAAGQGSDGVVQRAIGIGKGEDIRWLPRSADMPGDERAKLSDEEFENFKYLNDNRDYLFIFRSDSHLRTYLSDPDNVKGPKGRKVTPEQLEEGHRAAQTLRFTTIYKMATRKSQISKKAPGAHSIKSGMLPPAGAGHHWMQREEPATGKSKKRRRRYSMFTNQLVENEPTRPLTYGDPDKPSLIMSQGGLNLGMFMQPLPPSSKYIDPLSRNKKSSLSKPTLAGIPLGPSGSGRVRGHAFILTQNLKGIDQPGMTLDTDKLTYTDESNSAQYPPGVGKPGGVSSWREKEIERVAEKTQKPFTQINVDPVPGGLGGIAKPRQLYFRRRSTGGPSKYEDILIDNLHQVNYYKGAPTGKGKKYPHETEMGRKAARQQPFPETPVHRYGEEFDDPSRRSYPGYLSPPPSPVLGDYSSRSFPASVTGKVFEGDRVKFDERDCIVVETMGYNKDEDSTAARLTEIPQTSWPSFDPVPVQPPKPTIRRRRSRRRSQPGLRSAAFPVARRGWLAGRRPFMGTLTRKEALAYQRQLARRRQQRQRRQRRRSTGSDPMTDV